MPELWARLALGLALSLAGWAVTRIVAKTRWQFATTLVFDAAPALIMWTVLTMASARPLLAGTLVLALLSGFALADWAKRLTLREPVVFSDIAELPEVFRHPHLYLPYAGVSLVVGMALAAISAILVMLAIEDPLWPWSPWQALAALAGFAGLYRALYRPPLCHLIARAMRRFAITGDPFCDAAALGPSVMQFAYAFVARSERDERRAAAQGASHPFIAKPAATQPALVVVQSESFFDARRFHRGIPSTILQRFDACSASAVQAGQLAVPGWGANTVRTEFAVLTGLAEHALGFDRFNPYFAFARKPVGSLAWRLRAQGYRTLCLHPFDRSFYSRHRTLRNLGFEQFLDERAFAGAARRGAYVSDAALARFAAEALDDAREPLFLFLITMENHGPWHIRPDSSGDEAPALIPDTDDLGLRNYLEGLKGADAMLGILTDALARHKRCGELVFYGDHLPSLPRAFAAAGFADNRTDYFIWQTEKSDGARRDLAAHELPGAILHALDRFDRGHDRLPAGRAGVAERPLAMPAALSAERALRLAQPRSAL
jgi:hypothetical protein